MRQDRGIRELVWVVKLHLDGQDGSEGGGCGVGANLDLDKFVFQSVIEDGLFEVLVVRDPIHLHGVHVLFVLNLNLI